MKNMTFRNETDNRKEQWPVIDAVLVVPKRPRCVEWDSTLFAVFKFTERASRQMRGVLVLVLSIRKRFLAKRAGNRIGNDK